MSCRIHIPSPCHENWNPMQPRDNGRHCESCCKTVVDFTDWEQEAIQKYLIARQGEPTCGRFANTQLAVPAIDEQQYVAAVKRYRGGYLQKIAAIALLVFGLLTAGCTTSGKAELPATTVGDTTISVALPYPSDTVKTEPNGGSTLGTPVAQQKDTMATHTVGFIAPVIDSTQSAKHKRHHTNKK